MSFASSSSNSSLALSKKHFLRGIPPIHSHFSSPRSHGLGTAFSSLIISGAVAEAYKLLVGPFCSRLCEALADAEGIPSP